MADLKKVYILHGWAYSTEKWSEFVELLKEHGVSPIVLNIPGLTEKTDKVLTLDDYVEWLKGKVGGEEVTLLGHSNGGRISLAFALKYPNQVKQLILIDSAGIKPNGIFIQTKRFVFKTLAKLGKKLSSSDKLRALIYKLAREKDYPDAPPNMRETMANLIAIDLKPELHKIKCPTLIIWGEYDTSTPFSQGETMHQLIPDSKFYPIKDAKHSPQFTHPKEVADIIRRELA